jgi:hypothetical protein
MNRGLIIIRKLLNSWVTPYRFLRVLTTMNGNQVSFVNGLRWHIATVLYKQEATKQQFAVSDSRFTYKTWISLEANIHSVRTDKQVRLCQIWGAHTVWRLTLRSFWKQNRVLYFSHEDGAERSCINSVPVSQYNEHYDILEISSTVTNLGTVNVESGKGEVK